MLAHNLGDYHFDVRVSEGCEFGWAFEAVDSALDLRSLDHVFCGKFAAEEGDVRFWWDGEGKGRLGFGENANGRTKQTQTTHDKTNRY